jgi:ABC-type antimicrobial peptide transport system permease subunit
MIASIIGLSSILITMGLFIGFIGIAVYLFLSWMERTGRK